VDDDGDQVTMTLANDFLNALEIWFVTGGHTDFDIAQEDITTGAKFALDAIVTQVGSSEASASLIQSYRTSWGVTNERGFRGSYMPPSAVEAGPVDVAVDGLGAVYVAERWFDQGSARGRIVRKLPGATETTVVVHNDCSGVAQPTGICDPRSIAFDDNGQLLVTDGVRGQVLRFDLSGGAAQALLIPGSDLQGAETASDYGPLFPVSNHTKSVRRVRTEAALQPDRDDVTSGNPALGLTMGHPEWSAMGVAYKDGGIYVADTGNNRVLRFD